MVLPKATWKNKRGSLLLLHKIHVFSWHTAVRDNGIFTKGIEGENQTQTFQHKTTHRRSLNFGLWNLGCWLRGTCVFEVFLGVSSKPVETARRSSMELDVSCSGLACRPHAHAMYLGEHQAAVLGLGFWEMKFALTRNGAKNTWGSNSFIRRLQTILNKTWSPISVEGAVWESL